LNKSHAVRKAMAAPRRVVPIARPATAPLVRPLSLLFPWSALALCGSGGGDGAVDVGNADESGVVVIVSTVVGRDVDSCAYEVSWLLGMLDALVTAPTVLPVCVGAGQTTDEEVVDSGIPFVPWIGVEIATGVVVKTQAGSLPQTTL
jgi:hypothetical protein